MERERAEKVASQAAQSGGQCDAVNARERRWNECGLEEKVDRLRMVLRAANARATAAQGTAVEAIDVARRHEHGERGVLMPIAERGNNLAFLSSGKSMAEGDYFDQLLA